MAILSPEALGSQDTVLISNSFVIYLLRNMVESITSDILAQEARLCMINYLPVFWFLKATTVTARRSPRMRLIKPHMSSLNKVKIKRRCGSYQNFIEKTPRRRRRRKKPRPSSLI